MALQIHLSNRVEVLRDRLAETIERPPPGSGPLSGELILLDNPSLGPWINLQLALRHGVAANIRYLVLGEFFWELARQVLPGEVPRDTPLGKEEMTWRLLGLLEDEGLLAEPVLAPVRRYIRGDGDRYRDLKRFQLATRLADLYDQYLVYRPDWITAYWDQDSDVPDREGWTRNENWRNAEAWQRRLWRALSPGSRDPLRHRASIHAALCQRLGEAQAPALGFSRLSVFGVTAMAPAQLEALMGVARHADVHLYLPDPCRLEWFGIKSAKAIARAPEAPQDSLPEEFGNPLLAAQGTQPRDFLNLLYRRMDEHLEAARIQQLEAFAEPDPAHRQSLLTSLQQDILDLRYRDDFAVYAEVKGAPRDLPRADDGSLNVHVHNCHSPLREVEVLHDQLLALFRDHEDLDPRDVVVMMPRVGPYAPYIQAVFESAPAKQRIPYYVIDRTLQEESPILNSFQTLLALPDSRLPLSEVLGLLEVPAIHRRFGLAREDYERLRGWLLASGARWGRDEAQREATVGAGYREFSWAFGFDRLLAGYAMQADGDSHPLGVEPLDEIEGGQADLLDGFMAFWERLQELSDNLDKPRTPSQWHETLLRLLDNFYAPAEEEWRSLNQLREGMETLRSTAGEGWYRQPLSLEVIRGLLQPVLERLGDRRHPWSEWVKFCSLLPMRGVPFEVVYLLGMNMEDYPRRLTRPGFDLMRDDYRPGDRSARIDDRWLFLEALLSARRCFHVSYTGQDPHRNEAREPSVVVSELLDTIRDGYACPEGWFEKGRPQANSALYTKHPLQPFSADYFQDSRKEPVGGRRRSLDQRAWAVARAQYETRRDGVRIDGDRRWTAEDGAPGKAAPETVSLDEFLQFFTDPPRWFFRRLGVTLERYEEQVRDEERWEIEPGLENWTVVDALLRQINSDPPPGEAWADARSAATRRLADRQRAAGAWPLGSGGEAALEKLDRLNPNYLFLLAGKPATRHPLQLELHPDSVDGKKPAPLRLAGSFALHEGAYCQQSASNRSYRQVLDYYLRVATICLAGDPLPESAQAAFRNTNKIKLPDDYEGLPLRFEADFLHDRDRHARLLAQCTDLFLAYRESGLPFHPDTSLKYAKKQAGGVDAGKLDDLLEDAWYGTDNQTGMLCKAREAAYYGDAQALRSDRFLGVAEAVHNALEEWLGEEADRG